MINLRKHIDNIVFYIPIKKLRNSLREYLLHLLKNKEINDEIIQEFFKNNYYKICCINYTKIYRKKIIIMCFGFGIGDYMLFRPMLPFIREYYKYDRITLLVNKNCVDIVQFFDREYIDEYIYYQGDYTYISVIAKDFFSNLYYDILISPIRIGWCDDFVKSINAKEKISHYGNLYSMSEYARIDTSSYTKIIYTDDKDMFFLYRHMHFFSKLFNYNINITDISVNLQDEYFNIINFDFNKKYVIMHPSSSNIKRMWDYKKYQYVADHIYKKYGICTYLVGSSNERELHNKISENRNYVTSLCDKYKIYEIFYILNKSNLIIANDSSIYHIAMQSNSKNIIVISSGGSYIRFVNYPDEYKKNKIVSICTPYGAFDNPYCEYYFNYDFLNKILAEDICKLIDEKYSNYLL